MRTKQRIFSRLMRAHCRVCEQGWRATSTDSSLLLCHYVKEQKCDLSGLSCSSSRSVWVTLLVCVCVCVCVQEEHSLIFLINVHYKKSDPYLKSCVSYKKFGNSFFISFTVHTYTINYCHGSTVMLQNYLSF